MPPRKRTTPPRKATAAKKAPAPKRPPAKRGALSAVPDDAPPPKPPAPMTLEQAIESGTYLDVLEAQRRQCAKDLKSAGGPAAAALHRQMFLLTERIEALRAEAREQAAQDDDANEADEPFDEADL